MKQATPPKGLLGKAVAYALGQWERAIRYVADGRLKIDNNFVLCSGFHNPQDLRMPAARRVDRRSAA
jgi:hypothetical protein